MRLYLDTEFNGHGGELISLALATPEEGLYFYGVKSWITPKSIHPWVAEHVMPKITAFEFGPGLKPEMAQPHDFKRQLHRFLGAFPDAHIYADWPHDFAHLMNCLAGETYEQALDYQCTMHLIKTPPGEPVPEVPHNALSDAIALMRWHSQLEGY